MSHTIRVRILNRDFSLVVEQEDEGLTRELASYVESRIKEFRRSHPDQPELTAAVITAMAIAEEAHTERERREQLQNRLEDELGALARKLGEALAVNGEDGLGRPRGPRLD